MGRCPTFLNVDDFDKLAASMGLSLSDDGLSAIGEISEYLAIHILENIRAANKSNDIDFDTIIDAANTIGISLEADRERKTVLNAVV